MNIFGAVFDIEKYIQHIFLYLFLANIDQIFTSSATVLVCLVSDKLSKQRTLQIKTNSSVQIYSSRSEINQAEPVRLQYCNSTLNLEFKMQIDTFNILRRFSLVVFHGWGAERSLKY